MIGNNVLLDTSIVIELFKGDKEVLAFLEKQQAVFIATAVLGELYLGHTVQQMRKNICSK